MKAQEEILMRERMIQETEKGLSLLTKESLEAHQKAVRKQRMRKPESQG